MRLSQQLPAFGVLAAFGGVFAEDVLYSQRLQKRDIDADGNFNICRHKICVNLNNLANKTQLSSMSTMFTRIWTSSALLARIARNQRKVVMVATQGSRMSSTNDDLDITVACC